MESWCNGIRATLWPVPFPGSKPVPISVWVDVFTHATTNYHQLYKKARFARVRASRGHTQVYCRTPGALPYQPHPLDPLSLPILAVGVHLLYVCMYTYIVLVSFRPGQKSTCFSVKNTLDCQS